VNEGRGLYAGTGRSIVGTLAFLSFGYIYSVIPAHRHLVSLYPPYSNTPKSEGSAEWVDVDKYNLTQKTGCYTLMFLQATTHHSPATLVNRHHSPSTTHRCLHIKEGKRILHPNPGYYSRQGLAYYHKENPFS